MNELAEEVGITDRNYSKRAYFLKELSELTQIGQLLKSGNDLLLRQQLHALVPLSDLKTRSSSFLTY